MKRAKLYVHEGGSIRAFVEIEIGEFDAHIEHTEELLAVNV